ncbi:hypothetical protein TRAPUB_2527 [Trametes pubescens]|uniref:Uncharacterized protein n=1 Tax=Trametes pubescens TaxID=154538 RepID=A0A1M2VG95_TRAPU|nr:hypothetical protein TRAPUB_2527 [Trametes pubescens]
MDSLRALASARVAQGHPLERVFIAYPRQSETTGAVAFTVIEYDGAVARMLDSSELAMVDDTGIRLLEEKFKPEWDRVGVEDGLGEGDL